MHLLNLGENLDFLANVMHSNCMGITVLCNTACELILSFANELV